MIFIPQLDATDCGAACIAMIASRYKSRVSIARIREAAGTDRGGTNLAGMIKAAQSVGFDAKALKGDAESLEPDLPVPFIAHISKEEGDRELLHFVVVSAIKKKNLTVYDPAEGKQSWARNDFLKAWTGYVVFLTPISDFKPLKDRKGLFARFLPLLKPHAGTLVKVGFASLLLSLFGILGSLYFKYLIDEVLLSGAEFTLHVLSIGVVVLTLFQIVMGAVRGHLLLSFSMKVDFRLIFSYFRHVLRLPMGFFDSRKTGEILSRMEDAQKIRSALSGASISIVMDSFMVVVVGVALFIQSWKLFLIATATVPLSTAMIWIFSGPFARNYRKLMGEAAEVQSYLVEALNGSATVKALNASDLAFREYEKRQMKEVWTGYRLGILGNAQGSIVGLIDGWGSNVLFWMGSLLILRNRLTVGQLIAFNALLGYFLGPLQRLLNLQPSLQEAFVAADRLGEVLDLEEEIPDEGRWLRPERFNGDIEVKDLAFRYGAHRLVLEGFNCRIGAGEWVAFVGGSGSGKTTLVKLLLKFYKPEKGQILLDGHNLEDVDTIHLRSRIGYVPQDVFLFSGTIAENIALHHPDASLEEIVLASERAGAHQFIVNLPQRYNAVLSERGASLSGGERQRLALARALLGNPDLLVFDEATSNLDSISERRIHETLASLREDRITTIMIAHRLTTVVRCDKIFLMDGGRVAESGTHDELLASRGRYALLWAGMMP